MNSHSHTFPVVMYGCETWNIKNAEHRSIDAFELWFREDFLRVPWTAKRSNSSVLKEISPEYSFKGLNTEAEVPIFWPPDVKSWFAAKDPEAGKDWEQEEKGAAEDEMFGWHHWLNRHVCEQTSEDSEGQRSLTCCSLGVIKSQIWLSNRAKTTTDCI